jgi:hypothetical protein
MKSKLPGKDYRFEALVEAIVTSPQFRNARVTETREASEIQSKR